MITIACVPYLNARPLIFGLDREPGVALRLLLPRDLAGVLRRGEADAALLPAVEYFRLAAEGGERARAGPAHVVALDVAAVASRGAVGSARLFGYAEPDRLRRVLLDPASRTSNALARIIVVRRLRARPHFVLPEDARPALPPQAEGRAAPGQSPAPSRPPDAEVVMGDAGLVAERPQAIWIRDLGQEWEHLTHLPLVFALWVARADAPLARLTETLASARDLGLAAREAIAAEAPAVCGVPADAARRHLSSRSATS